MFENCGFKEFLCLGGRLNYVVNLFNFYVFGGVSILILVYLLLVYFFLRVIK